MTDHNDDTDATSAATKITKSETRSSTGDSPHTANAVGQLSESPPKKKRKVNHACVYCRRSHMTCDSDRPCKRCIKRNIGHLCHDEPRESAHRRSKGGEADTSQDSPSQPEFGNGPVDSGIAGPEMPPNVIRGGSMDIIPSVGAVLPPSNVIGNQASGLNGTSANRFGFQEPWMGNQNQNQSQSQLQDMHRYHPSYMFNANEAADEYNLLNDFLSNSLYDEAGMFSVEDLNAYNDPTFMNSLNVSLTTSGENLGNINQLGPHMSSVVLPNQQSTALLRPDPVKATTEKAREEKYYMTAADPSGTDPPEERMQRLLKAKYDAGMLKPFNYVNGYARLNKFMEKNMRSSSRHKILMQLDRFRPKFRERMQSLTDIELVLVEMWFERRLMEYDRIFASMAIPACCWRRTGEIFRGNKEMAELIHVPIESLREGKLAIHDLIVEDQLVSYWEKFCAICFDQQQKAMLTSCTIRSPSMGKDSADIHCCFSFTIKRDNHNIPSLIIGHFLPVDPAKH